MTTQLLNQTLPILQSALVGCKDDTAIKQLIEAIRTHLANPVSAGDYSAFLQSIVDSNPRVWGNLAEPISNFELWIKNRARRILFELAPLAPKEQQL